MTELQAAFRWLNGNDTGMSSQAICSHMITGECTGSYPYDPSDLGRCLRLLEKFPLWRLRLPEMAAYGPVWAIYVDRWDELHSMMADEVGIDWSKGHRAPQTYAFMKELQDATRERKSA